MEGDEMKLDEAGEVDAARDMIAAVKKGDAKALNMALKRHYEICYGDKDDDDDDGDDGGDEAPESGRY